MAPPYRNVIFDMDGTLIDSKPGIQAGITHALRQLGHEVPSEFDLDWAIGPPLRDVMTRVLTGLGDNRVPEAITHYREYYGKTSIFNARLFEGIPELLNDLSSSGRALFVGTSKMIPFARMLVEHFGLSPYFVGIYGSELDGRNQQKTELIRHLLDDGGLDPARTVMVGDREHDVIGARANGIAVIGVTYGYGSREELECAGASVFCETPAGLMEYL